MLSKIRAIFAGSDDSTIDDEAMLHLAAAALLIEVAKVDHRLDDIEIERMRQVLARDWGLGDGDLADLVAAARDNSESSVSLYEQIDLINRQLTMAQKCGLVRGLWQVACADGEIHHHEEALIRRLSDLLYVSHTDFIREKHRALGDA